MSAKRRTPFSGVIDTPLSPLEGRLRLLFVEAMRVHAPDAWAELLELRRAQAPEPALDEWAQRYNLALDEWVLPQVWYRAGLELLDPSMDMAAVFTLSPAPPTPKSVLPEPIPEGESRDDYIKRVKKVAGLAYDAAVADRLRRNSRRLVQKPDKHYEWLVRYQVGCEPYNRLWARSREARTSSVRHAVITLADMIGLTLRPSIPGRPRSAPDRRKQLSIRRDRRK